MASLNDFRPLLARSLEIEMVFSGRSHVTNCGGTTESSKPVRTSSACCADAPPERHVAIARANASRQIIEVFSETARPGSRRGRARFPLAKGSHRPQSSAKWPRHLCEFRSYVTLAVLEAAFIATSVTPTSPHFACHSYRLSPPSTVDLAIGSLMPTSTRWTR